MSKKLFTMYKTNWCGDCKRVQAWLAEMDQEAGVDYKVIDIEEDSDAAKKVEEINDGNRSVPTIVFSDGSTLTEPTRQELEAVLA